MISVKNINKYFNKRKSNEIHVINQTTLDFPSTGLVCLLGASGSGKTTLLNVVGGLDKIDNGEILFKDYSITKYKSSKWDYIRNRHFGYVFQNYILLHHLTVYQNLELVLKILNLDKAEIDERIEYALKAVGMEKYKKRKPSQLSGGQQQRIAIARALVKSPDVVIADEPTGNLDEKNTTQIMNIIKKISKECLVILVTHERRLAEFYGDRIIELADGKVIADIIVKEAKDFQELDNNNIYLQDLKKEEALSEDLKIKYFYKDNKEKFDLNIIFRDNTFYIQSPLENVKIKFLDKSSEIKVIDSKKPLIQRKNIEEFDYHLPKVNYKDGRGGAVIKFSDTIKMAFMHLGGLRKSQKLLFLVMFLSTIMVAIGFINLFSAYHVNEGDFLYFNSNLISTTADYETVISTISPTDKILINPKQGVVYQLGNGVFEQAKTGISLRNSMGRYTETNSLIPIEVVENPKLLEGIGGRLPEKSNEAVIDKYLVDSYLKNPTFSSAGIKHPEQFIGLTFSIGVKDIGDDQYKIVGIIENNSPNIYVQFSSYKKNFIDHSFMSEVETCLLDSLEETEYFSLSENGVIAEVPSLITNLSLKDNQILVDESFYFQNIMVGKNTINLNSRNEVEVVGIIKTPPKSFGQSKIYLKESSVDYLYNDYLEASFNKNDMAIYSDNPEALIEKFIEKNHKASTIYEVEYDRVKVETMNPELFITSIIILAASLLFLFFLMRSSMMSRIYQIGVYRALGIKKFNIYKIFLSEILIITFLTTIIGVFIVGMVTNRINEIIEVIYYPWFIAPLTILFMIVINGIVGLLPVNTLLRLTPSQILSKYDI